MTVSPPPASRYSEKTLAKKIRLDLTQTAIPDWHLLAQSGNWPMAMSAKCHDHEERSLGDENALQAPNDEPYHPDYFRCSLW
jgi:hypothetical protein